MLPDRPKFESWDGFGRMTRQHPAGRRYIQRTAPPAANAWLWQPRMIVRYHGVDDDLAVMTPAQFLDRLGGTFDLLGVRHQRGAVLQRPAVVLNVRDLHTARANRQRQSDHVGDPVDIRAVNNNVDGERDFQPYDFGGERTLAGEGTGVTGNAIGTRRLTVLNRNLHVIE